jgi:hypothetical protein
MVGDPVLDLASADDHSEDGGGPAYLEAIEEIDGELTKVIEDFMHAVDVEALRLAKRSGKHSLSQSGDSAFLSDF